MAAVSHQEPWPPQKPQTASGETENNGENSSKAKQEAEVNCFLCRVRAIFLRHSGCQQPALVVLQAGML